MNPYRLGFIGSTDTHNGAPGDVEEWNWQGSTGLKDVSPEKRIQPRIQRNPGGLVGIWAEENSRDALFDAMRRREVFATSGPRMTVRLFAGWDDFSVDDERTTSWCNQPQALETAYNSGVPMGGELIGPSNTAPFFAINAQRDPGTRDHPGGLLQRMQVIKVQAKDDGNYHQEIYEISGGSNSATVNLNTCEPLGPGANNLCTVWQDPDFDPSQSAAYYVRVIENPSCRWNTWTCLSISAEAKPATCTDSSEAKTTQERAWSSPIWYLPAGKKGG